LFNIPLDSLATTDFTKKKNAKTAAALREAGPLTETLPEEKPLRVLAFTYFFTARVAPECSPAVVGSSHTSRAGGRRGRAGRAWKVVSSDGSRSAAFLAAVRGAGAKSSENGGTSGSSSASSSAGDVEQTIIEHLVHVAVPVEVGQVVARAVGFELVVAVLQHRLVAHAAQDIDEQIYRHPLLRTSAGRESLLS
nr:hypothetical protein [Tanacetum cinerariifolium]